MTRCQWGAHCRNHAADHRCKYLHPADAEWRRENCRYGHKCRDWGKDVKHDNRFAHPGDVDWSYDPNVKRCKCRYGANCQDWKKKMEHDHQYAHPGDADWIDESQIQKLTEAEDAQRAAEEKAKEEEARRLAAEQAKREEEDRRLAAEQAKKEEEDRRLAAEQAKKEEEDRRLAAEQDALQAAAEAQQEEARRLAVAEEAKRAAEEKAKQEKARRLAAEQDALRAAAEAQQEEARKLAVADEARRAAEEKTNRLKKAQEEEEAWKGLGLTCRKVSQGTSSAVVFAFSRITDLYKVHPDVQKLSKAFPEHKLHIFSGVHGESGGSMTKRKERAFLLQDQALERLGNVKVHDYSQLCGGALDSIFKDPRNLIVHATCKSCNEAVEMCVRGEKLAKKEEEPKPQCGKCSGCGDSPGMKHKLKHQLSFKECLEEFNNCEEDSDEEDDDIEFLKMLAGLHMLAGEEMRPRPARQPARPLPTPQRPAFLGRPPQTPSALESVLLEMELGRPHVPPEFRRPPPDLLLHGMRGPPLESVFYGRRPPPGSVIGMGRPSPRPSPGQVFGMGRSGFQGRPIF